MRRPRGWKGWLLSAARLTLCVSAVGWLAWTVPWNDYVRLASETPGGKPGARVQLLEQRDDGFVVLRDGEQVTLGPEDVAYDDVDGQQVPLVEYGIKSVVLQADIELALLSVLIFLPVPLLQSVRLVWMLRVQDVKLSTWDSIKLTFAGNFFNFALPGTTGGDLIKAYYITRFTHLKTEAVTTVFLDRAVGLLGLVLLSGSLIFTTWDPERFGALAAVLAVLCGGLATGAILVFSRRLRHALRLPQIAERLPMSGQLLRVGRATVAMRERKAWVAASLANTVVLQCTVLISVGVMAWALGMGGSLVRYFIYASIAFLIAAIPISPPQAVGVMEYFYVVFFAIQGDAHPSQAVALALAVRLIQLAWAIPGVLVPLLGAHLPRQAELAALERVAEGENGETELSPATTDNPPQSAPASQ